MTSKKKPAKRTRKAQPKKKTVKKTVKKTAAKKAAKKTTKRVYPKAKPGDFQKGCAYCDDLGCGECLVPVEVKPPEVSLPKIAVICSPGLDNHLQEVIDCLKVNHEIKVCVTGNLQTVFEAIAWADKVWIEWANQMAADVTTMGHVMYQKQVILRLHSYEAFIPDLEFIQWAFITDLIFVAEHMKKMVMDMIPAIEHNVDRIHVIPNGIDCERFNIPKGKEWATKPGKDIAYLGYLNFKKGTQLMLVAFAELVRNDPEFKLHIAGEFQDPRYVAYLNQLQKDVPILKSRIVFHGWVEDPVPFLSEMSHIMCSSLLESQCKAVMEAMAMGLKPLIHNFVGARSIYPEGVIWQSIADFCHQAMSHDANPKVYRDFVVKGYNAVDTAKLLDAVLDGQEEAVPLFKEGDDHQEVKLSATMMMRDEAKNLRRCLDSIKDICDEIVIVDTGSKDKSIQIAKEYGAKVYKHKWEDDFSLHRNQASGYATGDWMLQIDCDEELVGDASGLKKVLSSLTDEYCGVSINLKDAEADKGNQVNPTRIFRRGHVKFRRAWHNIPIVDGMEKLGAVMYDGINIVHHGSVHSMDEKTKAKKDARTKILLEKSMAEDPEDMELYFYMMQVRSGEEDWQAAVDCGERYIAARNKLPGFQLAVYSTLIRLYAYKLDNIPRAMQLLNTAKRLLPEDLDVAFVECELGVYTGNGGRILAGARQFAISYKTLKINPAAMGGRFTFYMNPESLLFCMKHMTSYLLQDGVECLKGLQGSIAEFPEDQRTAAEKEVAEILEPLGINTN